MENRKLAKLALAALVLAANVPAGIQAHDEEKADGILLAAHACGSHCGAHRSEISDNSTPGTGAGSYSTSSNSYQTGSRSNGYGSTGGNNTGSYNSGSSSSSTSPYSNASGSNAYGGSSGYGSSNDTSGRSGSYNSDWNTNANTGKSSEWNANRSYGLRGDTDTYNAANRYESYTTTPGSYGTTTTTTMLMSDEEFKSHLDRDTKDIFDSLNRSGKDLAKTLASDPSYKDKNAAVKEAQRRTQGGSSAGSTPSTTRTTSSAR